MADVKILAKLQGFLVAYASVQEGVRINTGDERRMRIDYTYQVFCDTHDLYNRVGMPYHIWDVFKYTILLDEIMTGVLFDA
jgi:hypothetical protein